MAIADILGEKGAAAVAELDTRVAYHHLDVSNEAGWEQMAASITKNTAPSTLNLNVCFDLASDADH